MTITIKNGLVFIDGQPTTNAELIGYALLDFADTTENDTMAIELRESDVFVSVDDDHVQEKYWNFLKLNGCRVTSERITLMELLLTMNEFDSNDFVKQGMKLKASYATCYNFLQSCVDARILFIKPKVYSFKR